MGIVCVLPVTFGIVFSFYVAVKVFGGHKNRYSKVSSEKPTLIAYVAVTLVLLAILFALLPKGQDGELSSEDIYRMLLFSLLSCASPGIVLLAGKLIQERCHRDDE